MQCTALHRSVQNCLSFGNSGPVQQQSTITKRLTKGIHISTVLWFYYYSHGSTAPCGPGPPQYWGFMITLWNIILGKTHPDKWLAQHLNLLPDNIQQSHQTDIHATGGIRTRNPSKREAADPCLRMQGHWDWLFCCSICIWNLDPLRNRSKVWRYLRTQQWEARSQNKELTAECR